MARLIWIGPAPLRAGSFVVESMQIVDVTKTEQRHLGRYVRSRRLIDPVILSRQISAGKVPKQRIRYYAALAGLDVALDHAEIALLLVEYLTKDGSPTKKAVKVSRAKNANLEKLKSLEQAERDEAKAQAEAEAQAAAAPVLSSIDARRDLAFSMREDGETLASIAEALGVSITTVSKDLKTFEGE